MDQVETEAKLRKARLQRKLAKELRARGPVTVLTPLRLPKAMRMAVTGPTLPPREARRMRTHLLRLERKAHARRILTVTEHMAGMPVTERQLWRRNRRSVEISQRLRRKIRSGVQRSAGLLP